MDTTPYWIGNQTTETAGFPALAADLSVDVLVIGGGITGVSTAHLLAQSGAAVALVERGRLGGGDTLHTTAHLTYMTDTRLADLIRICGKKDAEIAWRAGETAIRQIRETAATLPDNAGFREVDGYLSMHLDGKQRDEERDLRGEANTAKDMGFDVDYLPVIPPLNLPGIRFPNQAKFHPIRYLRALAQETRRLGGQIFEQTEVKEFDRDLSQVTANGHRIKCDRVVIATHVPLQGNVGAVAAALFQTKLASYSTYAIAALYPAEIFQEMIWSDTAEPFRYLRIDRTDRGDLAIFGGEDHKTGQEQDTEQVFRRLEQHLERHLGKGEICHRWSGQVVETVDGLPFIGEITPGQFIATGFSGNGMTFGTVAALMARDWVQGKPNPNQKTFDPHRRKLRAAATYISENSDFPICMAKDRLRADGERHSLSLGEGQVIKANGSYIARCRDDSGVLHECSAVCPHMGCIVQWNPAEATWDCPCHGSRFMAGGKRFAGPAETSLESLASSNEI